MQAATTCLSWNISTARLARLRACMAAVSTSPPEEWQVAWERHMLECLTQCAAKAQEEGRHHVVKELAALRPFSARHVGRRRAAQGSREKHQATDHTMHSVQRSPGMVRVSLQRR